VGIYGGKTVEKRREVEEYEKIRSICTSAHGNVAAGALYRAGGGPLCGQERGFGKV